MPVFSITTVTHARSLIMLLCLVELLAHFYTAPYIHFYSTIPALYENYCTLFSLWIKSFYYLKRCCAVQLHRATTMNSSY